MELLSLSPMAHRPCILFKYPNAAILLDCAVDMDTLAYFLPSSIVKKSTYSWMQTKPKQHSSQPKKHPKLPDVLIRIGDYIFADVVPEVLPVSLDEVNMDSIDAILISNWMSLLALPFITQQTSFSGMVYATTPTIQLGRLVIEEFLDMLNNVDRNPSTAWRNEANWIAFFSLSRNTPLSNPKNWMPMYTEVEKCLNNIRVVYFRETISISGTLKVSAVSSGYSIGSCNWIIETGFEKIGYLTATSTRSSHIKPADLEPLRNADCLILTSLSRMPEAAPESMVLKLTSAVVETLKKGGSVLLPVAPTGVIYDLFELVYAVMEKHNITRDVNMYFVSSVAESTLAYSNIYSEWLSAEKSNKAYIPEDPFIHSELVKCGRLKIYDSIHGAFSSEFRTPCVLFAGHSSLRVGEVVHFLDFWGNDPRNCIIMTDPDFPLEPFYNPYKGLSIRAYYFPIDTRLDYAQLASVILPELAPRLLLIPESYAKPMKFQEKTFVVDYATQKTFCPNIKIMLPYKRKRKRVFIDPAVLNMVQVKNHVTNKNIGISPINGILSAYDNKLKILPADSKLTYSPRFGQISLEKLKEAFNKNEKNWEMIAFENEHNFTMKIVNFNAEIKVDRDGTRTRISCSKHIYRLMVQNIIHKMLKEI